MELFSKFNKQPVQKIKKARIGSFVYIKADGFMGRVYDSPNEAYSLALMDADGRGQGGYRESGNGKYLLAKGDDLLLLKSDIERPIEGAVADNGSFVIGDTLFGTNTNSILYGYDLSGRSLLKHHLNANIFSIGISADGSYIACQCANSDDSDSGQLKLFDLKKGLLLWSCKPVDGLADKYSFEEQVLMASQKGRITYRYSLLNGRFGDIN